MVPTQIVIIITIKYDILTSICEVITIQCDVNIIQFF